MSLGILSKKVEAPASIFEKIVLAAVKASFQIYMSEYTYRISEYTDFGDINFKKKYDSQEESTFINISSEKWVKEKNRVELINIVVKGTKYYLLTGTDDVPSHLCYDFSLSYLRIEPEHLISIYDDYIFSLKDIEEIEKEGGYFEGWYYKFKNDK